MPKLALQKGRYTTRLATHARDVQLAQELRGRVFLKSNTRDEDRFDSLCDHILVEERTTGELVCCFRFMHLRDGAEISKSYSAQFYDLSALMGFPGPMVELGRFCIAPEWKDPDILRIAWGALTSYVDQNGVALLFGCASFDGTDESAYSDAFAMLRDRHLGPKRWLPRVKAPKVFKFADRLRGKADVKKALKHMPPLLRTYLMMGGWVSDHAVIDSHMKTLHVFTGVEVAAIPDARKKLLRAVAG